MMNDDLAQIFQDLAGEEEPKALNAFKRLSAAEIVTLAEGTVSGSQLAPGAHPFGMADIQPLLGVLSYILKWFGGFLKEYKNLKRDLNEDEVAQQRALLNEVLRHNRISQERSDRITDKYFDRLIRVNICR